MKNMHILLALLFLYPALASDSSSPVTTGLDNIAEYTQLFQDKRVGIITNHTALNRSGKHVIDIFLDLPDTKVTALFGPEHGIKGDADAGEQINSTTDPLKEIPIYSLYGKTRKPTTDMLSNIDVLVFDIQDIGSRYYTYIWTMALAMEAAAEQGKTFVVLDRPNPLNGEQVEGNLLQPEFSTFVGLYPIPVRHGMTIGELAQMFNGEGWLENSVQADLKIIPLKHWQRWQWLDQTGSKFLKPSPNMPDLQTAAVYPGLCLIEGTNISEGRGTFQPFLQFGAPWIESARVCRTLNALEIPGIHFSETSFIPKAIEGMSSYPKLQGDSCNGVKIDLTDRNSLFPYRTGIQIINAIYQLYPDSLQWRTRHFDRLCGTDLVRKTIISGTLLDSLFSNFTEQEKSFRKLRKPYLLYH